MKSTLLLCSSFAQPFWAWIKTIFVTINAIILHHWPVLSGLTLASLIGAVIYRKKTHGDGCLLSALVSAQEKQLLNETVGERLRNHANSLYRPSLISVVYAFLCSLLFRTTGEYVLRRFAPIAMTDSWLTDSISIEIGISAILFPIVIFIVELAGDHEEGVLRKSEILLRGTFLFPFTMLTIFLLAESCYFHSICCAWTFVLVASMISAGVFYRTIQLLLNPTKMKAISQGLLKERVQLAVSLAIRERLQNNILFAKLDQIGVTSRFLKGDNGLFLYATRGGYVQDVDFCALREIVRIVDDHAGSGVRATRSTSPTAATERPADDKGPKVYFTTQVGRQLDTDVEPKCVLIVEPIPEHLDARTIKDLQERTLEAVVIGAKADEQEAFFLQMNRLKDFMLDSITERRTAAVEAAISDYVSVMDYFLLRLSRFKGAIHSSERAHEELHQIGGGWSIVDIVSRHLSEFSTQPWRPKISRWSAGSLPLRYLSRRKRFDGETTTCSKCSSDIPLCPIGMFKNIRKSK